MKGEIKPEERLDGRITFDEAKYGCVVRTRQDFYRSVNDVHHLYEPSRHGSTDAYYVSSGVLEVDGRLVGHTVVIDAEFMCALDREGVRHSGGFATGSVKLNYRGYDYFCPGEQLLITGKSPRKFFYEVYDLVLDDARRFVRDVEHRLGVPDAEAAGRDCKADEPGDLKLDRNDGVKCGPVLDMDNIPPEDVYDRVQKVTEMVYGRVRDFHKWVLERGTGRAGNANCEMFMYDVCTTAEGRVLTKAWDWPDDGKPYYSNEHFVGTFDDVYGSVKQIFVPFRDAVCGHCGIDPREHVLHELEVHDGDVWTGARLVGLRNNIEDEVGSFDDWLSEKTDDLRRIRLMYANSPNQVAVLLRRNGGAIVCLHVSDTCGGLTAEEAAERITSEFEREACAELGLSYEEYVSQKRGHEAD